MVTRKICGFLIICLFMTTLVGCGAKCPECKPTVQYVDRPVEVQVPIMVKPKIKKVTKPKLPVHSLKKEATPAEVAEAYYNSLKLEISYANKLEKVLSKFYED